MTSEWLEGSSSAPLGVRDDSLVRAAEPPEVIEWASPVLIT
jgi:hypothetical protein